MYFSKLHLGNPLSSSFPSFRPVFHQKNVGVPSCIRWRNTYLRYIPTIVHEVIFVVVICSPCFPLLSFLCPPVGTRHAVSVMYDTICCHWRTRLPCPYSVQRYEFEGEQQWLLSVEFPLCRFHWLQEGHAHFLWAEQPLCLQADFHRPVWVCGERVFLKEQKDRFGFLLDKCYSRKTFWLLSNKVRIYCIFEKLPAIELGFVNDG